MRACEQIRLDLPALIGGELSPAAAREIEDHLRSCAGCRGERDELRGVVGRLRAAPLQGTPPAGLEDDVFALVSESEIAGLVRAAPVEAAPPEDLERRALALAGASGERSGRPRSTALAASGIALALAGFIAAGLSWRGEATRMAEQFGPPGRELQLVRLEGPSPFPAGGGAEVKFMHYAHDDYGVVLEIDALPPCRPGTHYEVWLTRPGHRVSLGTFRVPGKEVYAFPLDFDPSAFTHIRITTEPMLGEMDMEGPTMWHAPL